MSLSASVYPPHCRHASGFKPRCYSPSERVSQRSGSSLKATISSGVTLSSSPLTIASRIDCSNSGSVPDVIDNGLGPGSDVVKEFTLQHTYRNALQGMHTHHATMTELARRPP